MKKYRYFVGYVAINHYLNSKYNDALSMFGLPKSSDAYPTFHNAFFDLKNKITNSADINRFSAVLQKKHNNADIVILGFSLINVEEEND